MVAVLIQLGQSTLLDGKAWLIAGLAIFFTFGPKKLNSMWIVAGGSILGYILSLI